MQLVEESVTLLSMTSNPYRLIFDAGTRAYRSERRKLLDSPDPDRPEFREFLRMLIRKGHESVIEHVQFTFVIVCDRGVSHEEVRHRLQSVTQESTRFCNYADGRFGSEIAVVRPPGLEGGTLDTWFRACMAAEEAYLALCAEGVAPQIARSVLPTCLKTELAVTMNAREIRHFIRLRTSAAAHPQIAKIASMVREMVKKEMPEMVEDLP